MLLQAWSLSSGLLLCRCYSHSAYYCGNFISKPTSSSSSSCCCWSKAAAATTIKVACRSVGINDLAEITHNKVLIAAALSAAIGQLSKPFTSTILYGNKNTNFKFIKAAFQSGGFPSTHSSAAVATAMSLGIERGFSDAIFGLAVVYASLVMYDAQGVRREVGIHAKALNRVLLQNSIPLKDVDSTIDSQRRISFSNQENIESIFLEEADSFSTKDRNAEILVGSENRKGQIGMLSSCSLASDAKGETEKVAKSWDVPALKESVGHNEFEVIAGALLGLFVSLAVYNMNIT